MLTTLRIKNLALVDDLTLEFQPGLNIITGETGAGKSILIGALNLALGERADRGAIRSGTDSCTVEAVFDVRRLERALAPLLEAHGLEPCDAGQLLLKRTFTAGGSNRQFVNGSPTTVSLLAGVGECLVDIHGPHDHQSLLHPSRQLAILDAFGNLAKLRDPLAARIRQRAELESQKADLVVDEKTYAQQVDLLRHQVREITAAQLDPKEEVTLQQDYQRASNASRLLQLSQTALGLINEEENSLLHHAGLLGRTLVELRKIDPAAESLVEMQEQTIGTLQELQSALSHYVDAVDLDPGRLAEMEERLNLIQSLKRKYGSTVAEILEFGEEAARRLQALEQKDEALERINAELARIDRELEKLGRELSAQRRKVIPKLAKAAMKQMQDLGFRQSHFDIALVSQEGTDDAKKRWSASGLDAVEFQFSPNPGEPPRPLRSIASSGEMARVMLALKTVLAAEDEIPVLVFDEVDANVGGETAQVVGEKMRQIADQRQVFCVTHLAPVAACAQAHYVVSKRVAGGRTSTIIKKLEGSERVDELARMLGGSSQEARRLAQSLLQKSSA